MSIKDRLAKKTEGLIVPGKIEGVAAAASTPLRTSPGQMLMVNSLMKESNEKVALLESRLKQFEGTLQVRLIDPEKINPSKWANRVADSFSSDDFCVLKEDIATASGNVQPIKLRPAKDSEDSYEIVFGHRRHKACLELGLPVLAFVEDLSDESLFKEMDRENRARADLSAWEQGRMYRRALTEGLFASLSELAKELGIDKGNVSKAVHLAELPDEIVKAFNSPLDLQFRWAKPLNDALQNDRAAVLERAAAMATDENRYSAKEVFEVLTGGKVAATSEQTVLVAGKEMARIVLSGARVSVHFSKGALSEEKLGNLHLLLTELLQR